MDNCGDSSDCDSVYDIFDIKSVPGLISSYDESINEDSEVYSMTSLGAFMLLSQNESKANFGFKPIDEHTNSIDKIRLSLAYERLHVMPKIILQEFGPYIKILDISNNLFENLNFLTEFKELTSLICDHNSITSSTNFPHLENLELLWLNHCKIRELYPWARNLQQSFPNLKYISLMGNAAVPSIFNGGNFYEYLQYRSFMISLFPKLVHLDDRAVTPEQHKESQRLYKKPLLERLATHSTSKLPACFKNLSDKIIPAQQKNIII